MRKPLLHILTGLLLLCVLLQPAATHAAEGAGECSLTLTYSKDGYIFENCEIEIFRVAQRLSDGSYKVAAPFDRYPVQLDGITSQREWQETADTLTAYVIADWIVPTQAHKTGIDGKVHFTGLQAGLYLVRGTTARNGEGECTFKSTMILLPMPQNDGSYDYDLEVKPKSTFTPDPEDPDIPVEPDEPELITYKVVKLWKDTGYSSQRPRNVKVEIYKDGVLQETVILNAANDWTYSWEAPKDDSTWTVLERDVAEDYTVTVTAEGETFTIVNSRKSPPGTPPKTGDGFPLSLMIMLMCTSGMLLVILGLLQQRKRK